MKKLLALVLAILLCAGATSAFAEEQASFVVKGLITQISEEGLLMDCGEDGMVLSQLNEGTILEGVEEELAVGQFVQVFYNGQMTRSIPAQITAEKVVLHKLLATVTAVDDGVITVIPAGQETELLVTLPEDAMPVYVGCMVTLYGDGVMTAALPATMNALYIVTESVSGLITQVNSDSLMIDSEDGESYIVNYGESTVLEGVPEVGAQATAYYSGAMTMSLPAQVYAIGLTVQSAQADIVETPAQENAEGQTPGSETPDAQVVE